MKYKKLKLTLFACLITSAFIGTNTYAFTQKPNKTPLIKTKFIANPTSLAAKSFALKKFGRNINILSNRLVKKSGCYKIIIKTKTGNRETLKICSTK
jgi:hypothetical protein